MRQKMARMKALRLSKEVPVNTGAEFVPVAVTVWVWVPNAAPVNVGAATLPVKVAGVPLKLGVDAAIVPIACKWLDPAPLVTALPVNVSAPTVVLEPVKVGAATVPAGVKLTVLFVGGFTGHATVPSGVRVVELRVPVTSEVAFTNVPTACRCDEPAPEVTALPVKVGCVNTPAAIVGTFAGHAITGCVKTPAAMVGTPAGQEIVCVCVAVGLAPPDEPVADVAASPAAVGTPAGQDIAPSANAPPEFVGTFVGAVGQEIAPSANAPLVFVPVAVTLWVWLASAAVEPLIDCAAAVREFTVSAGTVVELPVNTGTLAG